MSKQNFISDSIFAKKNVPDIWRSFSRFYYREFSDLVPNFDIFVFVGLRTSLSGLQFVSAFV